MFVLEEQCQKSGGCKSRGVEALCWTSLTGLNLLPKHIVAAPDCVSSGSPFSISSRQEDALCVSGPQPQPTATASHPAGMCCPDRVHQLAHRLWLPSWSLTWRKISLAEYVSGTKIKFSFLVSVRFYVDGAAGSTWWVLMWLVKQR